MMEMLRRFEDAAAEGDEALAELEEEEEEDEDDELAAALEGLDLGESSFRHPRLCCRGVWSFRTDAHTHQMRSSRISYSICCRKRIVIGFSPPFEIQNQRTQRNYFVPPRSGPQWTEGRARRCRRRKNCHGGRRPRYRRKMRRRTRSHHLWQVRVSHAISNRPKARESSWHITPWPSGQSSRHVTSNRSSGMHTDSSAWRMSTHYSRSDYHRSLEPISILKRSAATKSRRSWGMWCLSFWSQGRQCDTSPREMLGQQCGKRSEVDQ